MIKFFTKKKCIYRTLLSMLLVVLMLGIGPMQDLYECEVKAAETDAGADTSDGTQTPDVVKPDGKGTAEEEVKTDSAGYPEGTLYIKELRYFRGEKAKEAGAADGWIIHNENLNKGNKGDSLWLGYKTTTDRTDAVTAIKTMEMNGGYEITNYRKVMETTSKGLGELASALMTIASEFRENSKTIPQTTAASKDFLNLYITKNGGLKKGESPSGNQQFLGDLLLSGDYKEEDLKTLIMMINPAVYNVIVSRLAAGLFTPETNFAEKVAGIAGKFEKLSSSTLRTLDTRYQATVMGVRDQLQTFSKKVRDAKERAKATGGKITLSDGTQVDVDPTASGKTGDADVDASVEDIRERSDEIASGERTASDIKTGDEDLLYLSQLNALNRYNYDDSTKLGDYIVSVGEASFGKLSELRKVYPIIMAMTPGQAELLRINGFGCLVAGLGDQGQMNSKLIEMTNEQKAYLDKNGYAAAPVWNTEDSEFFESDIAYTKKLLRSNAAGATFTDVTKTTALGKFWNEFSMASGMISSVTGAVFSIVSYVSGVGSAVGMIVAGAELLFYGAAAGATATAIGGALALIVGICGLVAIVILIITLLVYIGKKIYNAIFEWDEYDYNEYKDIPHFILDAEELNSGEISNTRYYLVRDYDKGSGDLNCGNGKRWNAMYYTKSTAAGDPICASSENDFFFSEIGSSTEQAPGIEPVVSFSSPNAQAVNAYAMKKEFGSHFLYYRTSLNGEVSRKSKEKEEKGKGDYIADIRLFNGETETEAKSNLEKQGYKLYDYNVAPHGDAERLYTYIGYKTTNSEKAAVRDIRVCDGYPGSSVSIGEISYATGESSTDVTVNGAALCYTTNSKYGSPIRWKNLFFVKSRKEAKDGWEPVSPTCGGPAYNWNDSKEQMIKKDSYDELKNYLKNDGLYIYYKPDKPYTDGETYISGIQIVAGTFLAKGTSNYILSDYMDELGVTPVCRVAEDVLDSTENVEFSRAVVAAGGAAVMSRADATKGRYNNYDIWIAYSTTHNPYRALTDIKYYRSSYTDSDLFQSFAVNGTGYNACEKYCQVINNERSGSLTYRYFAQDHAVLSPGIDGTRHPHPQTGEPILVELQKMTPTGIKKQESVGLYVSGYVNGAEPIREKDLAINNSPEAPEGFSQIREFLNLYDTSPHNLGFWAARGSAQNVYMYLRGQEKLERPKYVKAVNSVYVETPTEYEQDGEKTELKGSQMSMYNRILPEQCRVGLIQSGAEEVLTTGDRSRVLTGNKIPDTAMQGYTYNVAKKEKDDKTPEYFCYIGVARTNKETDAVRGIIKYRQNVSSTDARPTSSAVIGGVDYTAVGSCYKDPYGDIFALYTSKNTGAGEPITDVFISDNPFESSSDTMLGATETDKGSGAKRVFASTGLGNYEKLFIHMKRSNSEKIYYSRLVVTESIDPLADMKAVQIKLLSAGCNRCIPVDMNKKAGGRFVLIGARTCSTTSSDIAIRDIAITVGKDHVDSYISDDGYEYISAGNVSLNSGTEYGKKIYVYYSHGVKISEGDSDDLIANNTDTNTTPTDTGIEDEDDLGDWLDENDEDEAKVVYMDQKPVIGLAASDGDFLPESIPGMNWTKLLDQNRNRVNANEGVIYRDDEFNVIDNRLYLYCAREGGEASCPEARVTETDGKYCMLVGMLKFTK